MLRFTIDDCLTQVCVANCPDESYFPLGESYKPLASEAAIKARMRPYCKLKMDQPRYTLLPHYIQFITRSP